MNRARILLTLFARFFLISTFVVGGGLAIIMVADEVFSKKLKWTEEGEILAHLPVFQMVPGLIATNTAIYVGNKVSGPLGAAAAVAGAITPSVLIFLAVTVFYDMIPVENAYLAAAFSGLRAGLTGIILAMAVRTWKKNVEGVGGCLLLAAALVLLEVADVSPIMVIALAAACGASSGLVAKGRTHKVFRSSLWIVPLVFLKYGLAAFGGGYVLVPMYLRDFVGSEASYLQLGESEFANVMAMTQMTPGAIGINCATFFGFQLHGATGAVLASVAIVLPGFCLLLLLLRSLDRYRSSPVIGGALTAIRPITTSLMLVAAWTFAGASVWSGSPTGGLAVDPVASLIALVVFVLLVLRKASVVRLIYLSAALPVALAALSSVMGF